MANNGHYLLRLLGSLDLTLALLILLALCISSYYFTDQEYNILIATPLFLLSINLMTALLVQPAFRKNSSLLLFHIALLALLILITAGRLSYLKAETEVTSGEAFSGSINNISHGLLHNQRIQNIHFILDAFTTNYTPGIDMPQRDATHAKVRWVDSQGKMNQGVVGDHRPLIIDDYRFYTTHNKGFAPVFIWQQNGKDKQQGAIHLPAYPAHEFSQALDWTIPGTDHHLWTQLQFDETIILSDRASIFHPPQEHFLALRYGNSRYEMRPGQSISFDDGILTYKELRTWMGFSVFYDWTLPWLFAAGFLAVLSLAWHYWKKTAARPWLESQSNTSDL
jgi:cytochrome c biogenesis protein